MPIGTTAALIAGGGALLGGIAGAVGSKNNADSGINLNDPSQLQKYLQGGGIQNMFNDLQNNVNAGPGQQDVTNSVNSSRSLADLLTQYSQSGGLPGQQDITAANGVASGIFAGQRVSQQQQFVTQGQEANQQAARLGRSVDDPILQAKLRTAQMNQSAQLDANQGSYASQLALNLPGQRLNYANQAAQVNSGLAQQALQNRMTVLGLGSGLLNQEQNYQINTSSRYGSQTTGGGVGGAISGALGGFGAGASIAGAINGLGGMAGAAAGGYSGAGYSGPSLGVNTQLPGISLPNYASMIGSPPPGSFQTNYGQGVQNFRLGNQ